MKLHVHVRSPYYLSVVVILIVVQQSETAGEKGGLFQRVDDSEIDERKENVRRQEEMRGLRQFVDRMEERSILDNGDSELSKTETPKTQIDKQKSDSGNIEEILDTIVALKQGFSEEKKATARLKRHVTRCNLSWITNVTFRENFQVYCDQQTDGGGWTVFQRRQDGSVDFFRDWAEYKEGFGSMTGEFWLGNENIYKILSTSKEFELRVDLGDYEGHVAYAKYSKFRIGPESDSYRLEVSGFSGDAGDALAFYHSGHTFKTKDRDSNNCSRKWKGGWWYRDCHHSNLNGVYNSTTRFESVIWHQWKGSSYSLRFVEMKFREID